MTTIAIFVALLIVLLLIRRAYTNFCLENVEVQLSMSATTATEGEDLTLTEVITNRKWLPLPWLAVKFQVDRELHFADQSAAVVSDFYYRNDLFHILMHQKITRRLNFTCAKRGYYAIRGLEVTGWDILMENKYIKTMECDTNLTVYPATLEMQETDTLCTRVYGLLRTFHPIHPDPFTFRGIREYSSHDPMKIINFKASAKAQELMVNVWDFSNARQVFLLLDVERHTAWHNEDIEERAIKIVASLAERFTTQGAPIAFATNGKSIRSGANTFITEGKGPNHLRRILESLAYINLAAEDPDPLEITVDDLALTAEGSPEYWLVSPYYSKGTEAALIRLKSTGARTAWIISSERPVNSDLNEEIIFI
ncbi:MAG: DUF58 domain-containing protein [Defluviitaleaceae bacterium]|nr:DUF58 domain-containing protein [Defluviitaleaceae bacterium]